ncbi:MULTISPECIES: hypothetical protein [unclassified Exiguobacterium]|uniref:hypothetical protein n=1 Tax=unclassified Exiguobacterium TaxID=2644629 RepID=UPI00191C43D7|nr:MULTISPECIES: hypothetical protein [unclassified Exiguobacterium]
MKFYKKTWFTVLTLLLFFPLGLFLMWKYKKFNNIGRIVISVLFGFIFIGSLFGDEAPDQVHTTESTEEVAKAEKEKDEEAEAVAKAEEEKKQKAEAEAAAKAEEEKKQKAEAEAAAKAEEEKKQKAEAEAAAKAEEEKKQKAEAEAAAKAEEEKKQKAEAEAAAKKDTMSTALGNISKRPVMNGTNTERIGTYVRVHSDRSLLTKESLKDFTKNDLPKFEDANWILVDLNDGYGIHFLGTMPIADYGKADDDSLSEIYENYMIDADTNQIEKHIYEGKSGYKPLF